MTADSTTKSCDRKRPARPLSRWMTITGVIVAAAALAACRGGGGSHSSSKGSSSASASSKSSNEKSVEFAQCMRSHGVTDFPDPQNGGFLINGSEQNNPNFQSAVQACQHLLPHGATNGGESRNSQLLDFAHCMQTHGVPQFPDPSPNGAIQTPQGVDPNSPQFQQAEQACQSKLPGGLQGQQP